MFSNAFLGLDLNFDDQVAPNDSGDLDEGANHLQNFPTLSTISSSGGSTHVVGSLSSKPNTQYSIDLYSNLACDASGNGEGAVPFGKTQINTNANGIAAIDITLPLVLASNRTLTVTATDPAGNTSEFSPCLTGRTSGSVAFSAVGFNALEEDVGNAKIRVVRTGGTNGSLAVSYATNMAPPPAVDYTPVSVH